MKSYKYLIKGQPMSFAKAHYSNENGSTNAKEIQLIWHVTLENQHEDRPIITENIEVFYEFFFHDLIKCKHNGQSFKVTPTISDLIKFASEMATGIVWKDSRCVVKSTAEKFYSKDPRTELTVILLGK